MNSLPTAQLQVFGLLDDSTPVNIVSLKNSQGTQVDVISYGGIITKISTKDKNDEFANIVHSMDSLRHYVDNNPYFGAIIGRYGNRIAKGKFSLNGSEYLLDINDGDNNLHGGLQGFDKKLWSMTPFVTNNTAGVILKLTSPDGDQGFPGTVHLTVTYTLSNDNKLDMHFTAVCDKPTIINLTQHSYFNLAGKGDILKHELKINAGFITPVDEQLIPTGEFMPVANSPLDFSQFKAIGDDIDKPFEQLEIASGYDHNYVLKQTSSEELKEAAVVHEHESGRTLSVYTDAPGMQFYSGNFLDSTTTSKGQVHAWRSAFCLEPQHHPDSPNQASFPSTVLMPEEQYSARIVYEFGVLTV